jgi:hypothetical protein
VRPADEVRAGPSGDRPPEHRRVALQTPVRTRRVDHGHGRAHPLGHQCRGGAARDQAHRRGVPGAGHPYADRDQTDRSGQGHRFRDTDRRFHVEGVWLVRGAPIRPPPAGFRPPGAPPSAPARPLAARRTGRAELPLATFPHTLPAVRQIPGPFSFFGVLHHPNGASAREPLRARHAEQSNKTVNTKPAVPTGFEPAVSSLTGTHVRPLHHGTQSSLTYCTGSLEGPPISPASAERIAATSASWRSARVRSPRVFSRIPRVLSVVRRNPPVSASG